MNFNCVNFFSVVSNLCFLNLEEFFWEFLLSTSNFLGICTRISSIKGFLIACNNITIQISAPLDETFYATDTSLVPVAFQNTNWVFPCILRIESSIRNKRFLRKFYDELHAWCASFWGEYFGYSDVSRSYSMKWL